MSNTKNKRNNCTMKTKKVRVSGYVSDHLAERFRLICAQKKCSMSGIITALYAVFIDLDDEERKDFIESKKEPQRVKLAAYVPESCDQEFRRVCKEEGYTPGKIFEILLTKYVDFEEDYTLEQKNYNV